MRWVYQIFSVFNFGNFNCRQAGIITDAHQLVIAYLIELEAVDSIGAIRKAFYNGNVDLTVAGDIEDVEILLGLRTERETPHPNYFNPEIEKLSAAFDSIKGKKKKIGRNDPCPCGSGKKYKKCCLNKKF